LNLIADKVLARTLSAAGKYTEVVDVILGGSYARGTWLPSEADIDVFARISPTIPQERFEKIGLQIGREATRGYPRGKKFAQHPYTEAEIGGVRVNIVPCYNVPQGKWKSAADRSPYHLKLMQESLTEKMRLEVRLLKMFMRVIGVYGAEIEKEGFSGYVAEVLILRHRTFENVLKYFATMQPSEGKQFIIPDPVDNKRNLATAVSTENVAKMILGSRKYLRSPSVSFFKKLSGKRNRTVDRNLVSVLFEHRRESDDILWGELKRTLRHVVRHIEQEGFKVARSVAATDSKRMSALILLPELDHLSEFVMRPGPRVELHKESDRFIEENSGKAQLIWVGADSRLHLIQRRRFLTLKSFLAGIIKREILTFGASPRLAKAIRRTGRVASGTALLRESWEAPWLRNGIIELASNTIGTD
jgi:tRNA nucleotidyltransferase (CCA-adding enzyme)